MIEYLSCPKNLLRVSTQLLLAGLALLLVGVVVAYGLDSRLSIGTQVAAHSAVTGTRMVAGPFSMACTAPPTRPSNRHKST